MGEESVGGRWPERRQSFSFFPDSIRALWVIASKADVSSGTRQRGKLSRKVNPPPPKELLQKLKIENSRLGSLKFEFVSIDICGWWSPKKKALICPMAWESCPFSAWRGNIMSHHLKGNEGQEFNHCSYHCSEQFVCECWGFGGSRVTRSIICSFLLSSLQLCFNITSGQKFKTQKPFSQTRREKLFLQRNIFKAVSI